MSSINADRFAKNLEDATKAFRKLLGEIVSDCERRQEGAEERLDRCRAAVKHLLDHQDSIVYRLLAMEADPERFKLLPEDWQKEIHDVALKLRQAKADMRATRDRQGW